MSQAPYHVTGAHSHSKRAGVVMSLLRLGKERVVLAASKLSDAALATSLMVRSGGGRNHDKMVWYVILQFCK